MFLVFFLFVVLTVPLDFSLSRSYGTWSSFLEGSFSFEFLPVMVTFGLYVKILLQLGGVILWWIIRISLLLRFFFNIVFCDGDGNGSWSYFYCIFVYFIFTGNSENIVTYISIHLNVYSKKGFIH